MASASTTVIKAGGSLLGGAADLERVAAAITALRHSGEQVILVVSALSGVTDLLERELWRTATGQPRRTGEGIAAVLSQRHAEVAGTFCQGQVALGEVERLAAELEGLLASGDPSGKPSGTTRGGLSRRLQTRVLSYGEQMSAPLVAAAVRAAGADARAVTSEELGLRAVGPERDSRCDLAASRAGALALAPELSERILVTTGFYGLRGNGDIALFGRGGTDYTAGVLAALFDADRLEFWKDLPGYFTANPRRLAEARRVPELSFLEASLLGRHGARILHPHCLDPVWDRPISVAVGHPADAWRGTRLVGRRSAGGPRVRALAVRAPRTVVRVDRRNPDIGLRDVGRMMDRLERECFALDAVKASRSSLCFSIIDDRPYDISEALRSLNGTNHPSVSVRQFPAWIGVIGQGVAKDPAVVAAVEEELSVVGPELPSESLCSSLSTSLSTMVSLGDSALRCSVERHQLSPVLRALHRRLFP